MDVETICKPDLGSRPHKLTIERHLAETQTTGIHDSSVLDDPQADARDTSELDSSLDEACLRWQT